MLRFRLGDEDRKQLGCPEWIEFDEAQLRVKELRHLQKVTGLKQAQWGPELDQGNIDLIVAFVWLALARCGVQVAYDDLDFDVAAMQMDGVADPGKAPAS